jgi:Putative rhamnosyl transferase
MQAIGLCRFSYPAIGGFQVGHESMADRIAYLYAEERLEERFRLFETVALPCLKAQTDPDFELIVVIGDSLPAGACERLEALLEDLPQARVIVQPPRPQREVMKELLNTARQNRKEPCLQFRFDDDDAVAVDFIETLRDAVADCTAFLPRHRSVAFDWNKGYNARFGADGIRAAQTFRPFYTAALAMHVRGGCPRTIMNFGHEKLPQFMPALSFPDKPMFVRGHNGYNDSRQKDVKPVKLEPVDAEMAAMFRDRFAIDVEAVKRAFSG